MSDKKVFSDKEKISDKKEFSEKKEFSYNKNQDYEYEESNYIDFSSNDLCDIHIKLDDETLEEFYLPSLSNHTNDNKSKSQDDIHPFLNYSTHESFPLCANPAKAQLIEPTIDQQDQQITCNSTQIKKGWNTL